MDGFLNDRLRLMERAVLRIGVLLFVAFSLSTCSYFVLGHTNRFLVYPVQRGDTLSGISQRFGVSVNDLRVVNGIWNPHVLSVGQELRIPYRGQKPAVVARRPSSTSGIGGLDIRPSTSSVKTVRLTKAKKYIGRLKWPARGRLSSKFGRRWTSFHEGVDVAAPSGTPIYAAHSGTVVYSGNGLRGYGNLVVVKTDYLSTVYAHNRRNLVRVGERVRRGEQIAEVGSTGKSTGPHLHFETRVRDSRGKNVAVDPLVFYR